jgi:putative ABC transport system permease protein
MIINYFKIAWRNLLKHKTYSAINILGLAIGMAVTLLIGLWVYSECTYDRSLPGYEQAYQVKRNFNSNGTMLTFNSISLKLADALRNHYPEIEEVAETDWMISHGLKAGEKRIVLNGSFVNDAFLRIFPYPFQEGNPATALKDPYSIILTASTAKALFGNEDAMDKIVRIDNKHDVKVTGILKDLPANSSFDFKFIAPFAYLEQTEPDVQQDRKYGYGSNGYKLYIRTAKDANPDKLMAKIGLIERTDPGANAQNSTVIIQPMRDWHLFSNYENGKATGGFIEYVRLFAIIGILVLLIACINFINLATARSEKRAREVGIRKAIGSEQWQLIMQFLIESLLITCIAFSVALLGTMMVLPAFNSLTGTQLSIPFDSGVFWLLLLSGILFTTLAAGSRPAFFLSAFKPIKVLKGTIKKGGTTSRKILVVAQFSCSIALIISTIIVYQQIQHTRNRPKGYHADRLLMTHTTQDLYTNYTALRNELLQSGVVNAVTSANSAPDNLQWHSNLDNWPGKRPEETIEMGMQPVTEQYFSTMGMTMASGRDFTADAAADSVNVILSETAVKRLRLKSPAEGQVLVTDNTPVHVIGVVRDALTGSPFDSPEPVMYMRSSTAQKHVIYRLAQGVPARTAIDRISSIFAKYNPAFPFEYRFADATYNDKFKEEELVGKLSGIFALLAMFISCMGLFGLAAFMAEQRTKEIGVRKVLGASVMQVWILLSKDFIVLVLMSSILASVLAFYFLQHWLQQYEYRINIGPGVFVIAIVLALVIALVTISFQAIKAALMNPVSSLKSE